MSKNHLILAAKFAVTSGLIYLVSRNVELDSLSSRLETISPSFFVGAALLIFFQNAIVVTWRWERVVAAIDAALPPWRLLKTVVITLFFNQVLPSTVGGDGMRVWLLRGHGRPIGLAFRSVLIDRLLGFLGLLLLSMIGALYLMATLEDPGPAWVIALVSLGGLIVIATAPWVVRLLGWLPIDSVRRSLNVVANEVDMVVHNKRRLLQLVGVSILGQFALSVAVLLLAGGLGVPLDSVGALAVIPSVMIVSAIPISIAGWGLREGTMVVGLGLLGVSQSDAALVSIAFGLLLLIIGLLGGLLWLAQGAKRPRESELRDMAATSESGRPE
ncbi:MAG: lysylphosphatidylglycerol synthase transmembrane domain-containing protein [Kiloniellales bacterium]